MIKFVNGNIFEIDSEIKINTVNCVGVMGKGIALEYKKRFPKMFKEYKKKCENNEIRIGKPHIFEYVREMKEKYIINFPTKIHWRNSSEYEYIELGLKWLRRFIKNGKYNSISIPKLGCQNGGLEWKIVRSMIEDYLSDLEIEIKIFGEAGSYDN